jgi:hypothetical protein
MSYVHTQKRKTIRRSKKQSKDKRHPGDSRSSRARLQPKKAHRVLSECNPEREKKRMDHSRMLAIQYVLDAANLITPPNWNVYVNPKEWSYKPGVLNIWLWIHQYSGDDDWEDLDTDSDDWVGQKHGAQRYSRISLWAYSIDEAKRRLESCGDGTIGDTEIWLKEVWLGVDVLIHELAHVVADRLHAWNEKTYRAQVGLNMTPPPEEDPHGAFFQRAYRIMIKRAEKYLSGDEIRRNKADLNMYEERLRLYGTTGDVGAQVVGAEVGNPIPWP